MKKSKTLAITALGGLLQSISVQAQFVFSKIADTSTAVPGQGVGTFTSLSSPRIRDGLIVFRASDGNSAHGIYRFHGSVLSEVAFTGDPVPSLPGYAFTVFDGNPNPDGTSVTFGGQASDGFNDATVIATANGAIVTLREDTLSTLSPSSGQVFENLGGGSGKLAAFNGSVAFRAQESITPSLGIYTDALGALSTVLDSSTPVPGLPGYSFTDFNSEVTFKGGIIAVNAQITNGSDSGEINLVALPDGSLTPVIDTVNSVSLANGLPVSNLSRFAVGSGGSFAITVDDTSGFTELLTNVGGSVVTVADENTIVPGHPTFTFSSIDSDDQSVDGARVVFNARFDSGSESGVYLWDAGNLQCVIDTTMLLEGKVISSLLVDLGSAISGDQIVFRALFTDGSVGNYLTTIPAPTAVADLGGDWQDASTLPTGWSYFDASAANGGTEIPLIAGQTIGNGGNTGFGGGANGFELGAVTGEGIVFVDGTANALVPGTDLAVHTGDDSSLGGNGFDYLILRYTISASDIANGSLACVSGSFRELVDNGGNSVTVYVYWNTAELWSATSANGSTLTQTDGTFNIASLPVSVGDTIDFVVYNNGDLSADETAIRATIRLAKSSYENWAEGQGLVLGGNADPVADPNMDGRSNLHHYAFSTDPLGAGGNEGKTRAAIRSLPSPAGEQVFTYTTPVRSLGLSTSAPRPDYSIGADGLNYYVQADQDLPVDPFYVIDEISPALSDGLPPLQPGWTYRTFYVTGGLAGRPKAFLQVRVEVDD